MSSARRSRRLAPAATFRDCQHGVSLIIALLMLVAILVLGVSAAQISLQGEKASRNERDRQIAFQAAEAGLMDAEMDIQNSPDLNKSRSKLFVNTSTIGFPEDDQTACVSGLGNDYLGLCNLAKLGEIPAWQKIDFLDQSSSASSVPLGRFTGQAFQTGAGSLPARPPRYVIEPLVYRPEGEVATKNTYVYRITAIGFGVHSTTQVLLQSVYRKEN